MNLRGKWVMCEGLCVASTRCDAGILPTVVFETYKNNIEGVNLQRWYRPVGGYDLQRQNIDCDLNVFRLESGFVLAPEPGS